MFYEPENNHNDLTTNEPPTETSEMAQVIVQVPQEPPKYSGRNPAKALQWLKEYEATASFNSHDDKRKLAGVRFVLREVAADWFDATEPFEDWDAFTTAFKARFAGLTLAHDEALKQLRRAYQKPMTPTLEHLESTLKWCRDLNPVPDEKDRIHWFLRSSNLRYRAALIAIAPDKVDNLRTRLATFDALMIHGNNPHLEDLNEDDDTQFGIRAMRRNHLQWDYDPEPRLHRDGRPYTPARSVSPSPSRQTPTPPRRSRSPRKPPTPAPTSQKDGPYLKGNRFAPDGAILCNWCGHPGHQISECLNRASGRDARRNPEIPLSRIQRNASLAAQPPIRGSQSPARSDHSPSRTYSRPPPATGRPTNNVQQPPQQQSTARPQQGNANGRWFNN